MIELKLNLLLNAQDVLSQWTIMLHAGRGELLYPNGLSVNQKEKMAAYVKPLIQELKESEFDYCRLGCERLLGILERETDPIMIVGGVDDLRRRMSGLSELMTCLFLSTKERELYEPRMPLFGTAFETKFASGGAFELDEAAKCLALERGTASVFHLMRLMEIAVRAVAYCLGIPDPTPGDRSWGKILQQIRGGINAKWPTVAARAAGDGVIFDDLYASLDAVKNPWRNATMHPANKYTQKEAEHVFAAVRGFVMKLADRMDENGDPKA